MAALPIDRVTVRGKQNREILLLLVFLMIVWALTAMVSPRFLSPKNLSDILTQAAPLGFVVIGQLIVIVVRGLDLSVASIMATAAVIATGNFDSVAATMLAGLGIGIAVGALNGYLIAWRGVTPFLATLATMIVLQGIRFTYTGGAPGGSLPDSMRFLSTGSLGGIPVSIMLLIVTAFAAWWLLERTELGRKIYLFGDNPAAARMSGYNVRGLTLLAFVISGALAAFAGLVLVGYVGIVDNWTGRGYELDSIAAAVIGGASLRGGKGSVVGVLLAALILISLFNALVIMGFSIEFQLIVKGLLILGAAAVYITRGRT